MRYYRRDCLGKIKCFYGDYSNFVFPTGSWAYHGCQWYDGVFTGEFAFLGNIGFALYKHGSRLAFITTI
ncbi:MAG: hypothetical protein HFJ38_00495 [Bacilli bacterium]|nr:hypothetical protein [Bacilli bacterium]